MTSSSSSRIVFIHSSNEMYGSDRMLLRVLDTLPPSGRRDCEVWLPNDVVPGSQSLEDELRSRGIAVRILPLPILRRSALRGAAGPLRLAMRMASLWARLLRHRASAVYCATSATLLAAPVARLAGTRHVVLHAQEIWRPREGLVLGALARSCTAGAAISAPVLGSLRGAVAGVTRVIENAMDASHEPIAALPDGPIRFLVASRWNAWKGHGTLLAAWRALAGRELELEILGGAPLMGDKVDVAALVAALPNAHTVTITGETPEVTAAIDRAHFVIVPSDEPEPFGLIAIEAFSRGRAVIASDAGGLADIVSDGETGRLFPPRDAGALAGILGSLESADAVRLGATASADFERRYSMSRFRSAFAELWAQLDDPRGRRRAAARASTTAGGVTA